MSHFSTVKTELRQRESLVSALEDLGYEPKQGGHPVRGIAAKPWKPSLAVTVQDSADFGFRLE